MNLITKKGCLINGGNENEVPYVPMTSYLSDNLSDSSPNCNHFEIYDKFLNVTYLVNDEFLQDWCNSNYEEKNIANKNVKECSVMELLFAIKNKLKRDD